MILAAIMFYVFAIVAIASGVMVVSARNPVHSVLFLILAFFNAAGLFLLMGAEFLAMILVIVYVGAVAVLFLFVVMMLDIDFAQLRTGALGDLLYTRYVFAFQAAGTILIVAMIGAIVLTLRQRVGTRRQVIAEQLARQRAETVEVVKVPVGAGVAAEAGVGAAE